MGKKDSSKPSILQDEICAVIHKSNYKKDMKTAFEEVVGYDYGLFTTYQMTQKTCLLEELDKKELQKILSEL